MGNVLHVADLNLHSKMKESAAEGKLTNCITYLGGDREVSEWVPFQYVRPGIVHNNIWREVLKRSIQIAVK